jgi:hypothetical protein
MKYYNVVIEADPEQARDDNVSALARMDLFFTVPERFPLSAGQLVANMLRDLHLTRYMKVTEIHELTERDFNVQIAA